MLIYEDNSFFRNSLVELLSNVPDFKIMGAFENCNGILEHQSTLKPDVILMDIEMSGTNGIEGLRMLRSNHLETLVLMLTVFEDNENIYEAICAGASGYLLKTSGPEKIQEAIRELLSGGAPLTPSIARKVLNRFQTKPLMPENKFGLSTREREILDLLVSGHSYKMIADLCFISLETVRSHIKKIYEKLQVHSATEAASKIYKHHPGT